MSSRAYLYGVSAKSEAQQGDYQKRHCWLMNWSVPLFWYACFSPEDEIRIGRTSAEDSVYPAFIASSAQVADRLAARQNWVLTLLPDTLQVAYGELYAEFRGRLLKDFQEFLLLDLSDFFALNEFEPEVIEAYRQEIAVFSAGQGGTVDDFPCTSAFNIGSETSPMQMESIVAEQLASEWRRTATGGPINDGDFPSPPSDVELRLAQKLISEFGGVGSGNSKPTKSGSKSRWKFWK